MKIDMTEGEVGRWGGGEMGRWGDGVIYEPPNDKKNNNLGICIGEKKWVRKKF
jgi:hypothetical protein